MLVMHPSFPEKTYYKIGEVAQLSDLKASVLRFWETEFVFLTPEKSSSGQRLYTRQDIETVRQIKQLLYHEKYTIEGVKKKFASRKSKATTIAEPASDESRLIALIRSVRKELTELRAIL